MISASNPTSMMSSSSTTGNTNAAGSGQQPPGLKTYFKTPEGRYKLKYEKSHPTGLLHYAHGKSVTQVTLAHLKDKPAHALSSSSSSIGISSGVKSAAAKFLGGGNGSRALSFVGGNGGSKSSSGTTKVGSLGSPYTNSYAPNSNFALTSKYEALLFQYTS